MTSFQVMLDLRRMTLLSDLADLGSVTAVAERRGITSSAVSQQLRVLEDEVDAILFRREGRTLGLTRSGHVLVEHVRRVLTAVDEAMSAVAATRDRTSGQIAIAAFNMGIPTLAAPLMQRLSVAEPDLRIAVQPGGCAVDPGAQIEQLVACLAHAIADRWQRPRDRLRREGTDHLLAGARAAGARRLLAQSFAGWPYAREGGPVKSEDDRLDPNPLPGIRDTFEAIQYLEETVRGADGKGGPSALGERGA